MYRSLVVWTLSVVLIGCRNVVDEGSVISDTILAPNSREKGDSEMSFPTHEPATPEKEVGRFQQKWNAVKAWSVQRQAAGLLWLLVFTTVAVASVMYGWWLTALVALAWSHAIPAYNWYRGASHDTKWYRRAKRDNKRSRKGRFGIFIATAALFGWLWFDEGFDMGLIVLVLFGIAIRLILRRDWTLLGAIVLGVLMGGEYGNGVSIGIALFASALVEYERRKAAYAAKQDRMVNRLNDLDQSQRPVQGLRPTGGRLTDYVTDPATDVPSEYFRGDGSGQAGVVVTEARTENPHAGYPAPPAHPPVPGEGREEERVPRPAHLPPTGSRRDEETGEHPTGVSRPVGDLRRPRPPYEEFDTGTFQVLGDGGFPAADRTETEHPTTVFRVPEEAPAPRLEGSPERRRDGEQG